MSLSDWANFLSSLSVIYFGWQQNQILKRQNEIVATQRRKTSKLVEAGGRSRFASVRSYWPTLVMVVLIGLTAFDVYDRHHHSGLLEFDDPRQQEALKGWKASADGCAGIVDGTNPAILSMAKEYKVAIACFAWDDTISPLDAPNLQISSPQDIEKRDLVFKCGFSPAFSQMIHTERPKWVEIVILFVPNEVQTTQFSTLRQARAMKVKIAAPHAEGLRW